MHRAPARAQAPERACLTEAGPTAHRSSNKLCIIACVKSGQFFQGHQKTICFQENV